MKPKARRAIRIGLWSVLALVVLIVAGAGIFIATFNPNDYKPRIVAAVKQATGRDLTLQGDIHLALSLRPTLTVQGVSFSNPPGFSRPQMATLQELDLQLALLPLLSHRVEIDRLVLVKPDILLETNAQGQPNWTLTPETKPSQGQSSSTGKSQTQINVAEVEIRDGTIDWRDDRTQQHAVLGVSSLRISAPSPDANLHIAMSASYDSNPFTLAGDVGPLTRLEEASAKTAWPVALTVQAGGATLAVNGSISQPEQARGYALKLTANVPDMTKLAPFAPNAKLPPLHDVKLAMQLADTGAKLPAISDVTLHVGASDLSGIVPGLKLDTLDLTAPKPTQPVQIALKGSFGNAPATLNGTVGIPPSLLSGGKLGGTVPIDLTLQAVGSNMTAKGTAGEGPGGLPLVNAAVQSSMIDGDAVVAALGKSGPAPGPAPGTAAHAPPKPAAAERMIPDTPLPFGMLRSADANVTLNVAQLKWGGALYHAIAAHLVLQGGKLTVDPVSATLPEGQLSGALTADATQPAPPVTLKLNAPSLAMGPIFAAMGRPDYLSGNLNVNANLRGAGNSPHAIAASLNGTFGASLANGSVDNRLLGSTLGSVLQAVNLLDLVGRGGVSQVQCFAARMNANRGIADVQTLALSSSLVTMTGTGTINLGDETIDLHLRPEGRIAGTALVVPVHVTGPLRSPHTAADTAGAVTANAGTVAGAVIGNATPLGLLSGALGGQKLLGGTEAVNCGAALAAARGEAVAAPPTQSPPPAAPAPGRPAPPKLSNPGAILKKLIP